MITKTDNSSLLVEIIEETTTEVCRAELNFNEMDIEADVEAKCVVVIVGNSFLVEIFKDDSNEVDLEAEINIRVEVVSAIDVEAELNIRVEVVSTIDEEAEVVVAIIGNSFLVEIFKDDSNEAVEEAEINRRAEAVSAIDVEAELNIRVEVVSTNDEEAEVVVVIINNSFLVEIFKDDSNEVDLEAEINRRVEAVFAIDVKPLATELASVLHKVMLHWVKIAFEDPRMHKLFPLISN
jgi:hypothetical protein